MTRRRQSGAWLSSSTRSGRLPHLAHRSRCSATPMVASSGRRDTGTTLAGHLPQSARRVRQAQQPRQVRTKRQVAKSAASDPSTIPCNRRWLILADMGAGSISCLPGARGITCRPRASLAACGGRMLSQMRRMCDVAGLDNVGSDFREAGLGRPPSAPTPHDASGVTFPCTSGC